MTTGKQTVTQEVQSFFHDYAVDFDAIYGHTKKRGTIGRWIDKYLRRTMFLRFEETLKNTSSAAIGSVFDIGCGPGRYLVEFVKQGKKVIALDLAKGMLDIAASLVPEAVKNGSITFVESDYMAYQPPFKCDAAVLMGFFDYIEHPVPLINKLKGEINKEIYGSFPQSGGFLAWQRTIRYKMKNCPLYLYSLNDIKKIMSECGLDGKYEIKDFGRDYFVKITL